MAGKFGRNHPVIEGYGYQENLRVLNDRGRSSATLDSAGKSVRKTAIATQHLS
jgi:hypothetical protein